MRCASVLLLAVALLLSACSAGDGVGSTDGELPQELVAAIESFYAAIESDDIEARVALLAEDVVMMPNHWSVSRGKERVAEVFRAAEGAVFRIRDREVLKAACSGDVAYTVNSYYYTYHAQGDEPQWHKTKNVHIWRRNDVGEWKLEVDIWNSDVPISAFDEE